MTEPAHRTRRTTVTRPGTSGDHAPDPANDVEQQIRDLSRLPGQPADTPTPRRRVQTLTGTGPKWQQIATDLQTQIETGQLAPGDDLPAEAKLQTRYNVARNTVRQAIQALRASGLVVVEHGRSTKVRYHNPISAEKLRFNPVITRDQDGFHTWDTQGWADVETPSCFRGEAARYGPPLGIDPSVSVFVLERQLVHDSGAEITHRLYMTFDTVRAAGRDDAPFLAPADLYQALTGTGHALYWEDTTTAAMPSPDEAATLDIPEGVPVLVHTRITHNSDSTPLVLEETHLPVHRITMTGDRITTSSGSGRQ